jgi:hypothetical protein
MSDLTIAIERISNLLHLKGCTVDEIKTAEDRLGISFPDQYKEYLSNYGAISFQGTEWTGLNVDNYIDVVSITERERINNAFFPHNCVVLENAGDDGLLILINTDGLVFNWYNNKSTQLCTSLLEYLEICKKRIDKN